MKHSMTTVFFFILFLFVQPSTAGVIRIPSSSPSLKSAFSNAHNNDTVFIDSGMYEGGIWIEKNVSIIGRDNKTCGIIVPHDGIGIVCRRDVWIKNLTFKGGAIGIRTLNCIPVISNNVFIGNKKVAIHCIISCPSITNNTIVYPGIAGLYFENARTKHCRIRNNVVMTNGYSGLYLSAGSRFYMENNVISSKQWGVFSEEGACAQSEGYNCIYAKKTGQGLNCFKPGSVILLQPEFISPDTTALDYHLKIGSDLQKEFPDMGIQNE